MAIARGERRPTFAVVAILRGLPHARRKAPQLCQLVAAAAGARAGTCMWVGGWVGGFVLVRPWDCLPSLPIPRDLCWLLVHFNVIDRLSTLTISITLRGTHQVANLTQPACRGDNHRQRCFTPLRPPLPAAQLLGSCQQDVRSFHLVAVLLGSLQSHGLVAAFTTPPLMGRSQGATRWRHHSLQRRAARPAGTSIRTHNPRLPGPGCTLLTLSSGVQSARNSVPRWPPAPPPTVVSVVPLPAAGTHILDCASRTSSAQRNTRVSVSTGLVLYGRWTAQKHSQKLDLRLEQSTCTPPPPPPPATGRSPQRVKLACKPAIHAGLMGLGAGASQLAQSTAAKKQEASEQDCFNAAPLKLRTALACSEPPGAQRLVFFVWALRLPRLLSALWAASCVSATN